MSADVHESGVGEVDPTTAPDEGVSEVRKSAFASVPDSDYVMDGLALVLLLVSLSLPWTSRDGAIFAAGDVAWVLPVTLLSVLSLTLPYLARFGILPANWTVHSTRRARVWANLPYPLIVVLHYVLDGAGLAEYRGLGSAVALGLAGAALAATPRRSELGPEDQDPGAARTWWSVATGGAAAVIILMVVWLVMFLIGYFDVPEAGRDPKGLTLRVLAFLAVAAVVVVPLLLTILTRSIAWRNVSTTFGIVLIAVFFAGGDGQVLFETLRTFNGNRIAALSGAGVVLVPAVAAILASPAASRRLRKEHDVTAWLKTGNAALRYIVTISLGLIVVVITDMVDDGVGARTITALILLLLAMVLALLTDRAMLRNIVEGRKFALIGSVLLFLLGLSLLTTEPVQSTVRWIGTSVTVTWALVALAIALPLLVVISLIGPASVREFFGANAPSRQARSVAYEWQAPAQYPAVSQEQYGRVPSAVSGPSPQTAPTVEETAVLPVSTGSVETVVSPVSPVAEAHPQSSVVTDRIDTQEMSSGFTPQIASDPQTAATVLAEIAEVAPHLRPYIAANPSTYPALLDWLRDLNDPAVDEALRSRTQ